MDNLRIRLFGAPTIELNGEAVDPRRRKVIALAGGGAMEPRAVLAYFYNRGGRKADAERAAPRFEALGAKGMSLPPRLRAYIPLGRGDHDEAMGLIEQA